MNDFSDESMTRPLFEEPTAELGREDPWSGSLGFMIGGMALPTRTELAEQYFIAANILVERIIKCDIEDYKLVNPVLFLYRHSIELMLKGVMRSKSEHHKLDNLADYFVRFIKDNANVAVPRWITARLKEIAKIDPNSTTFRYAETWCKDKKLNVSTDGEIYVDLFHLKESMAVLYTSLAGVIDKISPKKLP